jgi:Golgi apyrase
MGGASAQIAFQPTDALASKYADNLKSIKFRHLNGEESSFHLYLHSFLGFGMNEAFRRFNLHLAQGYEYAGKEIPHPCLPKGLQESFDNMTFFGTGDFDSCYNKATFLLNKQKKCQQDTSDCYFDGTIIPLRDILNHHFIAVSEFWYTTDNVFDLGGVYNPQLIRQASESYCSKPWQNITEMNDHKQIPHVYDSIRLEQQCFKIAYIMNVLSEGLRLPSSGLNSTIPVIQTIDKIDGIEPSWTLGAILMHVSANVLPNMQHPFAILKIALLALPILTAMSIAFIHYKKKARNQNRTFDMSQFHKQYVTLPQRLVD